MPHPDGPGGPRCPPLILGWHGARAPARRPPVSLAGDFQAMRPLQAQIVLSAAAWRHQTQLLLSGGRENGSGGGWEEGGCKGRGLVPTLSPQPPRFLHISWWVLRDALWGKFRDLNPFTSQQMRLAWKRKDPRCLLSLQKSKCSCVIF